MMSPDLTAKPRELRVDDHWLALYKPAGLHVFGTRDSIQAWLVHERPELAGIGPVREPAIVHRLDGNTSGLLLAARTQAAYERLRTDFRTGRVAKTYLALTQGVMTEPVLVDAPLGGRYRRSRVVQVARKGLRLHSQVPAESHILPLAASGDWTLCRIDMRTGARHQIRAHLAHIGHPVAGDLQYGAGPGPTAGAHFWLHAYAAAFSDPVSGQPAHPVCPPDEERLSVLRAIGLDWECIASTLAS